MMDSTTQAEARQFVRGIEAALSEYENAIRYSNDPRARMAVLRAKAEQTMLNQAQGVVQRVSTELEAHDIDAIRRVLEIFGGAHTIASFERIVARLEATIS